MDIQRGKSTYTDMVHKLFYSIDMADDEIESGPLSAILENFKTIQIEENHLIQEAQQKIKELKAKEKIKKAKERFEKLRTSMKTVYKKGEEIIENYNVHEALKGYFARNGLKPEEFAANYRNFEQLTDEDKKSLLENLKMLEQWKIDEDK